MQALSPYAASPYALSPDILLSKLNPRFLSHIKTLPQDIFDWQMIEIRGRESYDLFWDYLAHGAIYASGEKIFLRTFNDIRIFSLVNQQVNQVIYRHAGQNVEKIEQSLTFPDFCNYLDYFIREFIRNIEPFHVDLLTTRYFEELPIDITITKAALEQFAKLGLIKKVMLHVKFSKSPVSLITVLPSFFSRIQKNLSGNQTNSQAAPVFSNRKNLHIAHTVFKANETERKVHCTTGTADLRAFDMRDLSLDLSLENSLYPLTEKKFNKCSESSLRVFIDYRKAPWIEREVNGIIPSDDE